MIFPVGLALFSRGRPDKSAACLLASIICTLHLQHLATGKVAGMIETMDGSTFWGMHAAIIAAGAVLLVMFALFRKLLANGGRCCATGERGDRAGLGVRRKIHRRVKYGRRSLADEIRHLRRLCCSAHAPRRRRRTSAMPTCRI